MWYDNNGTVYSTNHQICLKTFKYPNRKIRLIFNNFTRRHADPNLCGGPRPGFQNSRSGLESGAPNNVLVSVFPLQIIRTYF